MNLHGIVSGAIGTVNPFIAAEIYASSGYETQPDGTQGPAYAPAQPVQLQVQALQYNDIAQLDGLNIQGERRAVYLSGNWNGVIHADQKGGDLLQFPEFPGAPVKTWMVAFVFEYWADWTKLAVTLQSAPPG